MESLPHTMHAGFGQGLDRLRGWSAWPNDSGPRLCSQTRTPGVQSALIVDVGGRLAVAVGADGVVVKEVNVIVDNLTSGLRKLGSR